MSSSATPEPQAHFRDVEKTADRFYDYPDRPVPADKKKSCMNIAMVTTGMAVAMSTLYTGSSLAAILSYKDAVISIVLGCMILAVIASLIGNIAAAKSVPFAMLGRHTFGQKGSYIVGMIFAISMLGWFSYQCGYFGETIELMVPGRWLTSTRVATFWGGLLMMSTAVIGYKGMTFLSFLASPLLLILCSYAGIYSLKIVGWEHVMADIPTSSAGLGTGITIVVGSWITGAILQPDIARFARTSRDNILGSVIAMCVFAVANWGGLVIAKATGAETIMAGLVKFGMGIASLFIVILGQWTSNDNNLYSGALAIVNVRPRWDKHKVTVVTGVLFTILALLGIQKYFVNFLVMLGTFLPPFGAVVLCDYYLLAEKGSWEYEKESVYPVFRWQGFVAAIIGGGGSFVISFGVPALNALILAAVTYYLIEKIVPKMRASS